jgi:hypothetical protein
MTAAVPAETSTSPPSRSVPGEVASAASEIAGAPPLMPETTSAPGGVTVGTDPTINSPGNVNVPCAMLNVPRNMFPAGERFVVPPEIVRPGAVNAEPAATVSVPVLLTSIGETKSQPPVIVRLSALVVVALIALNVAPAPPNTMFAAFLVTTALPKLVVELASTIYVPPVSVPFEKLVSVEALLGKEMIPPFTDCNMPWLVKVPVTVSEPETLIVAWLVKVPVMDSVPETLMFA